MLLGLVIQCALYESAILSIKTTNSFNVPGLFFLRRICAGCSSEIGHGRYLSCMGAVWHPECFCCHACNQAISDYEVLNCSENTGFTF